MELSALVSTDSRSPEQRTRRYQVEKVALAKGVSFIAGVTTKDELLAAIKAAGINIMDEMEFRTVHAQDEHGRSHVEMYPVIPEHKTAGQPINYVAELEKKSVEKEKAEKRVAILEEENSVLKLLEARLATLEKCAIPLASMVPWQLKRIAKDSGIDIKGMSKEEMISALEG